MTYFFWESARWFGSALCRRYMVVQLGKLQIPMGLDKVPSSVEWHWALGLFTDARFQVLGAWRDEGSATPLRIAANLHDRGLERITALAADTSLVVAMKGLGPKACEHTVAELAKSGPASSRVQQAIRWTDTVAQHLQERVSRAARRHGPFADHAAAAAFIAQAFQRADRDLLADYWGRVKPAPYGLGAAPHVLARAA